MTKHSITLPKPLSAWLLREAKKRGFKLSTFIAHLLTMAKDEE